ncbi:hypothetical protein ABZ552_07320 [Nocardia sp. NPDC019219]|uniref:hypothetical protein n=1 Tax=Nocardia sp. NPDC019219 TaxID=3154590 RepID=UPI0033D119B6
MPTHRPQCRPLPGEHVEHGFAVGVQIDGEVQAVAARREVGGLARRRRGLGGAAGDQPVPDEGEPDDTQWRYADNPVAEWLGSDERTNHGGEANPEGEPAVQGTKPFTHEQHMPG